MNLTEFLKYYTANKQNTFGTFIYSRRTELGYSLRKFSSILGISPTYLSDIETGARPAPTNLLPVLIQELKVTPDEIEAFFDLVNLSRKTWPTINQYLTTHPNARKFLNMASEANLPDNFFKKLLLYIDKQNLNSKENTSSQSNNSEDEIEQK